MQTLSLTQRLHILKALHACFILTLLCTGIVGLVLFSAIVSQPIRNCPVLHAIYTVFWLSLGLSILQVVLAIIFFLWFLFTFLLFPVKSSIVNDVTTGQCALQVDHQSINQPDNNNNNNPFSYCSAAVDLHCGQAAFGPFNFSRSYCDSEDTLDTSSTGCSDCCQFKIGWFCFGSIFLGILSIGLILSMILVGNFLNQMDTIFNSEMASIFVEARVSYFNLKTHNNAFMCWEVIQKTFQCCGQVNYTDWSSFDQKELLQSGNFSLPASCYSKSITTRNNTSLLMITRQIYTSGCSNLVIKSLYLQLTASRVYLIVTFILLVTTFLIDFTYTLYVAHITLLENPIIVDGDCSHLDVWQHSGVMPGRGGGVGLNAANTTTTTMTRKFSTPTFINNHNEIESISSSSNSSSLMFQNSAYQRHNSR
ncbi:unnamed protein product [Trichobilharzia szidati]|nr:unnamed protein product [Trichobilharzia szidati]